ncbi:MAG: PKD domain-containing protein [Acidobacteria bacterium]|nr:PKD domain-containing protein [Acidobacteriota bacterium]
MRKRIVLFLFSMFIVSFFIIASFWTEWTEYPSNPIFDPANASIDAYYPSVLYDASSFSGHGISAPYKMWFDRDEGGGIAFAYSNDGINWTEYNSSAPLSGLQAVADHPVVVYNPSGFGTIPSVGTAYYRLWYWWYPGGYTSVNATRTARSPDGLTWYEDQSITQHATDTNLQLIFGAHGTYFYHNYGPGYVIYNSSATNIGSSSMDDKTDDQPMTWAYQMYYLAAGEGGTPNGSAEQEALAYSTDGYYWIRYGTTPVLMGSGVSTDWDYTHLYGSTVLLIGGVYHMWYIGSNNTAGHTGLSYAQGIGHATSPDGLNWTRDADNPAMHMTDGIAWRGRGIHAQCVLYDAANFSGNGDAYPYKMWYSGVDASNNHTIGYAYIPGVNQPPVACFTANPTEGYAPLTVAFNGGCSYDPDGATLTYRWDFGDGTTAIGLTVSHTYNNSGEYTVILTVIDSDGARDQATDTIIVNSDVTACCTCDCTEPVIGYADYITVTMDGSCSSQRNGLEIVSYLWNFGDGTTASGIQATHTYTEEGNYFVELEVIDELGNTDTATCLNMVYAQKIHPPFIIRLERSWDRSLFKAAAFHKIIWNANAANSSYNTVGFRIYRKLATEPDESYQLIGSVGAGVNEFTDSNLPYKDLYSYTVSTVLEGGYESRYSNAVQNNIE